MFPQVFHHKYVVYKNVIQRGTVWKIWPHAWQQVDMQRVDTQWGGRERRGEDLEALTSIVIGSWSICKVCMVLGMKYHGRALPCACLSTWFQSTWLPFVIVYCKQLKNYTTTLHSWNCDELNRDEMLYIKQIQGHSHKVWSGQASGGCICAQQVGGSGGMPPLNMRLLLRPFLGQNDASRRPDDRVLHAWISTISARCAAYSTGYGFLIVR